MSDSQNKPAVLVMDDDEDVLFIANVILGRLGFDVVLAVKGDEAIDGYIAALEAGKRFYAVILDVNIPGGPGGSEVLIHLKELDPLVNAFITSGNPFDPLMENPTAFGFTGAIPKPFSTEELRILLQPQT